MIFKLKIINLTQQLKHLCQISIVEQERNLKTREQLKTVLYEQYTQQLKEYGGVLMFYLTKSDTYFGYDLKTKAILPKLTEREFYEKCNEIEEESDFICFVSEDHPFVRELEEKMKTEEGMKIVERNKKIFGSK